MCQEQTELLWIGCLTGLILILKIQIRYIGTKHQLADILTKGNFTRDESNNLRHLFNISHFSSTCCAKNSSLISCPKTMGKRMREQKGEERRVEKSKSTATNLSSHVPTSSSSAKSLIASKSPGILIATEKPQSRMRRNSKSDASARWIPWRGWWTQPRGNLSLQQKNQEMWTFPNLKLGVKKMWQGNRLLVKQLRGNPLHPVNLTSREVQKLKG